MMDGASGDNSHANKPGMSDELRLDAIVPVELAGQRLDKVLAQLFGDYSRARLQQWVRDGRVLVNGVQPRPRDKVHGGEQIELNAVLDSQGDWQAEPIPLTIVYEDETLLVINKPAGLVVHPAVGNRDGTLLNALLHHAPELEAVPRAGIVHRLDKDTSGLLVIARTLAAHKTLIDMMQARDIQREYEAVVQGVMTAGNTIEAPVGRHPVQRTRMAVVRNGRPAVTHYRVSERFRAHTHIRVQLETGRTHQIRVHMAHIHYPLLGDPVYGGRLRIPAGCSEALNEQLHQFRRQALHAARLQLDHPRSGETMEWLAPLPEDMQNLLTVLRADAGQ
jgi:23S rRNA pseudouridine1911/1915/1917 synthase